MEGVTETNLGWAGRQESGRVTKKGSSRGSCRGLVDPWRPGPSKGPANSFSAAVLMRTLPCAPHSRGGQSRVIWRIGGTCRGPGAAPVHGRGALKWMYLATNALRLPPRRGSWTLSSRPRTRHGISLRTKYQFPTRGDSFVFLRHAFVLSLHRIVSRKFPGLFCPKD